MEVSGQSGGQPDTPVGLEASLVATAAGTEFSLPPIVGQAPPVRDSWLLGHEGLLGLDLKMSPQKVITIHPTRISASSPSKDG